MSKRAEAQQALIARKEAIERIVKSKDGEYFIDYLASICLMNLGAPCKDAFEYAYNEGRRSVFLAVLQLAEKNLGQFIHNLVKSEERSF